MKKTFRSLPMGTKFTLNGIEYIKTNFGRGYIFINGRKQFINVKKAKIVEVK